jgi:hypothetical protein
MKKLLWAALLALPFAAVSPNRAAAHGEGCCWNIQGCWRLKIGFSCNTHCFKEPLCCNCPPCGSCGYGGGYGGGGCADGGCSGQVPGPWYTYWPYGGQNVMTSPVNYPYWVYDMHFQTPAPVPPYYPVSPTPFSGQQGYTQTGQFPYSGFQPAGYYPSYWYGR